MAENILELIDISKEFPGVKALSNVNINIKQGEIHAVVGENGAGKSTLMKIISGVHPHGSYTGTMRFLGEERRFNGIRDSEDAGIAIIYQELALVKEMNIAENVYLGNEILKKNKTIDWNLIMSNTSKYLAEVGLDINPMTQVLNLGIGQQQLVEIAKALAKNAKLLILDEPTAALTEAETDNLMAIMEKLNKRGVTCVFITHKLEEVFRIADAVTVIRDGHSISTDPISEMTNDLMISRMVGRDMTERFPRVPHEAGETILKVENWTVKDPELPTRKLVDDVSFELKRGEILGIAGLMGSGRTELAMSIFGCFKGYTSGKLSLEGKELNISRPIDAIKEGISYLSEDRKKYGLNMLMDIEDNITLAALDKISTAGVIDNSKKVVYSNKYIGEMNIKTPSSRQMVVNLSGGNQQKVVLGKWLMTEPKILILDEPTRGIDIGAKYEIYTIMNKLIEQGVSVIMISSELPEVLGMSDRIIVMHEGKLKAILDNDNITQEVVMTYATGGTVK
ncbi:MAG: xylose ABC transporter ATP-binding protein [Christensenellaceae bacterium]|nr:xylose ABC transporter ATP-binding protein [Christensenellaceae bacterium]